jgi:hypothetical protein
MQDINYDLIKLLHCKMDSVWRLKKFYCDDAQKAQCESHPVLQEILKDEERHISLLAHELKQRMLAGIFK